MILYYYLFINKKFVVVVVDDKHDDDDSDYSETYEIIVVAIDVIIMTNAITILNKS